jgi:DNA replicative helicase MCM subunit Mcm2 (Cdc46/Mcm family)
MSRHILEIHRRGVSPVEAQVDAELLRKYVSFAKSIQPELSMDALNRLSDFYLAMRSQAKPKVHLLQLRRQLNLGSACSSTSCIAQGVTAADADAAIAIMKRSRKSGNRHVELWTLT